MSGGCSEVDVVVTGTGTHYDFQLLSSVQYFGIHLVRADDQSVSILDGIQQLRLLGVLL